MKKIRLLTISPTCERGGSDINLLRLLKNLDKNEYEILHLIPYAGPIIDELKNAGVRVEVVDMPRIRFFKNPLKYIIVLLRFFPAVFRIRNIIVDNGIDIVCTSSMVNLYGALAARFAHRPHILMVHEYLFILRLVSPYFYHLSEKIICCSRMASQMFKKNGKVLVRHLGLDLDEFSPDINTDAIGQELRTHGKLISMFCRFAPWKGPEVFIRAANYIKSDVKFIIFGEPVIGKESYLIKLKKTIEQLGLKDKVFINSENNKNIPQIMAISDIIVHASLRPEPFGLVIIEAMAMGKPVIASKLGAPQEIITDGEDGILLEPGNPKTLALAISRLLQEPEFAKNMAAKAREKVVQNFDIRKYAEEFDAIFKSMA